MDYIKTIALVAGLVLAGNASANEVLSEYTTFERDLDCALIAASREEGDWAEFVCPGYRGYPVFIRYSDGRETVTYGFATETGMPNIMPFNEASGTVEWRLRSDGQAAFPFAAIQRWTLIHPEGIDAVDEMLVVSRVGQPMEGGACAVAFIPATGNPAANEQAREIADARAESFTCGSDAIEIDLSLQGMIAPQ